MIWETAQRYLTLGFTHVIPMGFDHILFILSIYFLNSSLRSVLIQCSVFTVAHSLSLGLAAAGVITPDARIIEPLIAVSILFTSVENILQTKVNRWRLLTILVFGLIHGMGFATALKETGLQKGQFLSSLLFFNIGVELGQVAVILLAYALIGRWFSQASWYKSRVVYPVSCIIGSIAFYWTVERILG